MVRVVELRRHTANQGDVLTEEGVGDAILIGLGLEGDYDVAVSTGAQRATQTIACFLAGLGERMAAGVVVEPGLRSGREDDWRAAYQAAGSAMMSDLRAAAPGLVDEDSHALGTALARVFALPPRHGRALVVGHSPTNEAAVLGLTGQTIDPLAKGGGVIITRLDGGDWKVEPIA